VTIYSLGSPGTLTLSPELEPLQPVPEVNLFPAEKDKGTGTQTDTKPPASATATDPVGSDETIQVYRVDGGDRLNDIADRFGVKPSVLRDLNRDRINADGRLLAGELLILPKTAKDGTQNIHAEGKVDIRQGRFVEPEYGIPHLKPRELQAKAPLATQVKAPTAEAQPTPAEPAEPNAEPAPLLGPLGSGPAFSYLVKPDEHSPTPLTLTLTPQPEVTPQPVAQSLPRDEPPVSEPLPEKAPSYEELRIFNAPVVKQPVVRLSPFLSLEPKPAVVPPSP
jgi:hypothetical protein